LYSGPVVLKKILDDKAYELFLALSVAVSIMLNSSPRQRMFYLGYAKQLLQFFVNRSSKIFGNIFVVYNVHGLLHLHEDVQNFDCSLNDISAVRFENYLQKIKQLVRHGNSPISQVCKRMAEARSHTGSVVQKQGMCNVPIVSPKQHDCCFMMTSGDIVLVRSLTHKGICSCSAVNKSHFENLFTSL